MADFLDFCKGHGILINELPPMGVWKRYPTADHPRKRNGAVKYMGTHGFVQNHAVDTVVTLWQSDKRDSIDQRQIRATIHKAEDERRKQQHDAIRRAVGMMNGSGFSTHPYLESKGFPDEQGNVLHMDGKPVLLIPMRVGGSLVGLQMIDADGGKKFLFGQRTSGATFTFDNKGINIICEGYATALSVRAALKQLKRRYTLHVCFSAGNMLKVAEGLEQGLTIADNDASGTGKKTAELIGWPYWMSDRVGEDANDCHQRLGLFKFSQSLNRLMFSIANSRSGYN